MNKRYYYIGAGTLIVALIIFLLFFNTCSGPGKNTEKANKEAGLKVKVDPCADELAKLTLRAESLQIALNKCLGIKEPLTPEEEIELLKREVEALKKAPKQTTYRPAPYKSAPAPDVTEKNFGGGFTPQPSRPSTTVTTEMFNPNNAALPITQFEGGFSGAYCLTINDDGYLVYAVKNTPMFTQAPRLNSENGNELTLDPQSDYWVYIDYTHLVSVQEINNYDYAVEWNIYIGQTNYGTGSYPTYLPHQSLKPLINKVRGKEWGEISDDDLVKMRRENSDIWTSTTEGTLRPFRLDATNGRAYGKEDKNLYQGWNFRTRIYAKKRTTTTGYYVPVFKNYYLNQKVNTFRENLC